MTKTIDYSLLIFALLAIVAFVMNILYFSTSWALADGRKVPKALDNLVSNYSWAYLVATFGLLVYVILELASGDFMKNVANNASAKSALAPVLQTNLVNK